MPTLRRFDVLLAAAATTLPGIPRQAGPTFKTSQEREAWMFDDRRGSAIRLIESFAASIAKRPRRCCHEQKKP